VLSKAGASERDTLKKLLAGVSIVKIRRDCDVGDSRFRTLCTALAGDLRLYDGVRETLDGLTMRKTALGVVTNLPGWLVELLLTKKALSEYFGPVVHAGNCAARKPDPGPLQSALRSMRLDAGEGVLYVGDRDVDARAAAGAGVGFAWASYGYGPKKPPGTTTVLFCFRDALLL
jgi:phosphoglycolate phosphatase-like HAD superfamily hydrolase